MRVLYERCCGRAIHQQFVVAGLLTTEPDGTVHKEVRTDSTRTTDLLALTDWLRGERCGPVVLESTGSSWRPVFNRLEGQCAVLVVKASHAKAVPGRKTDVKDAEWLADPARATACCVRASSRLPRRATCATCATCTARPASATGTARSACTTSTTQLAHFGLLVSS